MVVSYIILASGIACYHLNKMKTLFVSWKTEFAISSPDQLFAKYEKNGKKLPKQGHISGPRSYFD